MGMVKASMLKMCEFVCLGNYIITENIYEVELIKVKIDNAEILFVNNYNSPPPNSYCCNARKGPQRSKPNVSLCTTYVHIMECNKQNH